MSYEVDWGLSPTGEPKRTPGRPGLSGGQDSRPAAMVAAGVARSLPGGIAPDSPVPSTGGQGEEAIGGPIAAW